jgi:hypothetical protein
MEDRDNALLVQEELFNILWDDTVCRIRQTGTNELLVNKLLMQVQQYTFMHLTHYDQAYTSHYLQHPLERMKELRHLVSLHVVREQPSQSQQVPSLSSSSSTGATEDSNPPPSSAAVPNVDQIDRLAWYIEANYQNIMLDWPDPYYREGRVQWVDLPSFEGMRDPQTGDPLPVPSLHPDDVLPHPWLFNITRRGDAYYWNPETRESTWERPT